MANDPFSQQNWPDQNPPLGTGEGEVPLAPPPVSNIEVRTMASDVKSVQESGSGTPRPYTPPPQPTAPPAPSSQPPEPPKKEGSPFFQPPQIPVTPISVPRPLESVKSVPQKKSSKGVVMTIIVLVVVFGLAAAGYFIIYPKFFSTPGTQETPITTEPPVSEETQTPVVTPPLTEPSGNEATPVHVSFFKTAPDLISDGSLSSLDIQSFKQAFTFETADVPLFKEVVLKDNGGTLLTTSQVLKLFLPSLATDDTLNLFENDLTFFLYTDGNGTWPGLILKTREAASLDDAKVRMTQIETTAEVSNLFIENSGTLAEWRSGQTGDITNRYLTSSMPGASINYAWKANFLILSASYDGFKEALKLL